MDITDATRPREESNRTNSRINAAEERLSRKIDYLQDRVDTLKASMIASRLSMQKEIGKLTLFWWVTVHIIGIALLALGFLCLGEGHP